MDCVLGKSLYPWVCTPSLTAVRGEGERPGPGCTGTAGGVREQMPEFVKPFSGMVPERRMTKEELVRALRLDLAAEHEAVHSYLAHADATDDPLIRAVLIDIADEERVHAGEFSRLIAILTGNEDDLLAKGKQEVDDMAASLARPEAASPPAAAGSAMGTTIGSLIQE